MAFKLSQRSFQRLVGVHPKIVETVKKAIEYTDVDFGVIYGVRDNLNAMFLLLKFLISQSRCKDLFATCLSYLLLKEPKLITSFLAQRI